ncbi:MAG TPA: RDD family protein, partial [Firmicutes bacterium]|nr:RDD family protein [Bacillota bacterium]
YYCQECIVVRRGRLLCRSCAEALFTPTEEEILMAQERGLDMPEPEVTPEEAPEFQIGNTLFGQEGQPASPVKRLLALLLDLLLTRAILALGLLILGVLLDSSPNAVFHLFDSVEGESTSVRVATAFFLFQPVVPWLIIMAIVDFLYFFLTATFNNRTFGMSWVGCRLVTEWGDFVSTGAVAVRTLVFMVFLGWPAILIGAFFPAYRGPHDYVAGTIVINYAGVKRVDAYETVQIKL